MSKKMVVGIGQLVVSVSCLMVAVGACSRASPGKGRMKPDMRIPPNKCVHYWEDMVFSREGEELSTREDGPGCTITLVSRNTVDHTAVISLPPRTEHWAAKEGELFACDGSVLRTVRLVRVTANRITISVFKMDVTTDE